MQEIKFRAWHKENEEMVYFNPDKLCKDQYQQQHLCHLMRGDYGDVLNQFTGVVDKKNTSIYQDDILSDGVDIYVVKIGGYFSDSSVGFGVHYCKDNDESIFVKEPDPFGIERKLEVIGNLHENPELLDNA